MAAPPAAAGWYPDPSGKGKRYWTGTTWTSHRNTPPAKSGKVSAWVFVVVLVLFFGGCVALFASSGADDVDSDGSYPDDWECIDPTPKRDGACQVSGGGVLDTGLSPGWIRSAGPRPSSTTCAWRRLDGPSTAIEHIIDTGAEKSGPVEVHIRAGDFAFWSEGCQPWQRISSD